MIQSIELLGGHINTQLNMRTCKYLFAHYARSDDFHSDKMYPPFALVLVDFLTLGVRNRKRILAIDFTKHKRNEWISDYLWDYRALCYILQLGVPNMTTFISNVIKTYRSAIMNEPEVNDYVHLLTPNDAETDSFQSIVETLITSIVEEWKVTIDPTTLSHLI